MSLIHVESVLKAFYLGCFESVISGPYIYHFVAGVHHLTRAPHKVTEKKKRISIIFEKSTNHKCLLYCSVFVPVFVILMQMEAKSFIIGHGTTVS